MKEINKLDIPVLTILFNRPNNVKILIEKLKVIKPKNLYVAIDGPREDNKDDIKRINECKKIIEDIDWDCRIYKLYRTNNLGCAMGVSSAISWFFEKVEMGIILEDDCIPCEAFFEFSHQMLIKYRYNNSVLHINGARWNEEFTIQESYFYSNISHIWGWATWKRAWSFYDFEMKEWPVLKKTNTLSRYFQKSKSIKYWENTFDRFTALSVKNTWDYQWQYTIFLNNGIVINPRENLVQNIGVVGVHTNGTSTKNEHFRITYDDFRVTSFPPTLQPLIIFNDYHTINHFCIRAPLLTRLMLRIKKMLPL